MNVEQPRTERPDWGEERLRYKVLSTVYDRAGASCERTVTGTEIGSILDLRYEDMFRVIHFLESHGYLKYLDAGPRVCLTPNGLRYIEELAGRRRSIRLVPEWGRPAVQYAR